MTSLDSEIDQSEIRTKTPATLGCTQPSHNALHSIFVLVIICQQIWPAQSIHEVFLQIFPKVTLFSRNCVLPSIPEMPQKQNKRTHDKVLLYRTAKAEKKVRVNDREDTLCEPKVVGCLSGEFFFGHDGSHHFAEFFFADRVADGMEQSWITAHVFQLTCLLTDVSCPTCGETGLYISVCEGSDQWARFASKLALTCDLCEYKKF